MIRMTRVRPALLALGLLSAAAGCGGAPVRHAAPARQEFRAGWSADAAALDRAERRASPGGRKVLAQGRTMALDERVVLVGSCWDYINAVFERAGFGEKRREKVYGTRKAGPYVDPKRIQPGDWLYFVNHTYSNIEHSGIFVDWIDESAKNALILGYAGQDRREPGRYLPYELDNVYAIFRPRE